MLVGFQLSTLYHHGEFCQYVIIEKCKNNNIFQSIYMQKAIDDKTNIMQNGGMSMGNEKKDVNETIQYGKELGTGIKEGLKGLNTMASPKKKKVCINLILIALISLPIGVIATVAESNVLIGLAMIPALLSGACNFYVGNFKKGILYTFTCGIFYVGILIDLFKLKVTGTFKDGNGFPVIY